MLRAFLWRWIGRVAFRATPHNAYPLRRLLLCCFGMRCGARVRVRRNAWIDCPWNVSTGDRVGIGDGAVLLAGAPITIGSRCVISQYTMLLTRMMRPDGNVREERITIEDNCWVATDTVVLPGSHIETGVVVGARSMVDGRLPDWHICTGEPAEARTMRVLHET